MTDPIMAFPPIHPEVVVVVVDRFLSGSRSPEVSIALQGDHATFRWSKAPSSWSIATRRAMAALVSRAPAAVALPIAARVVDAAEGLNTIRIPTLRVPLSPGAPKSAHAAPTDEPDGMRDLRRRAARLLLEGSESDLDRPSRRSEGNRLYDRY